MLDQAYAPFLENMTLGILPKHIWQNTTDDAFALDDKNNNPIGAGPYAITSIAKNSNGIPTKYTLSSNKNYISGQPYIDTINFSFYSTEKDLEDAYLAGDIDAMNSISAHTAKTLESAGSIIQSASLPRIFGVFFNQNQNVALADKNVRIALDTAVDRDYIVNTVLQGYGSVLNGPVPQRFLGNTPTTLVKNSIDAETRLQNASQILDKAGWKLNADGIREKKTPNGTTTLSFAISTSDSQELKDVGDILKSAWQHIGAKVEVKIFEGGYLNQSIIRPRKYDALLFGQIVNHDLDLYAFWHSSQRTDPGLNIALHNNPKADKLLENIRIQNNPENRIALFNQFTALLTQDVPALFLYAPNFIYVTSKDVHNQSIDVISDPSDRFSTVSQWYINTERIWKIFRQYTTNK
jgi:peptide/nickel transport system substrate-binding protein